MPDRTRYDIVVVGGGPAGMAAAVSAAAGGMSVLLVDDNPGLGGQIWRGEEDHPVTAEARLWREQLQGRGVEVLRGARVFDVSEPGVILAESWNGLHQVRYWRLILATGARERFLPFPGWTLPNVMGAGGLQALVKSGLPIRGKRVVVAGSGPLLPAVAAYLRQQGAEIVLIAEQASWTRLARFATTLLRLPGKVAQSLVLWRQLAGVPYRTNCWPVAAEGDERLESVTLCRGARRWRVPCDYLACGFHLLPNVELAALLGCELLRGCVAVDDMQGTSVDGIFCAGEPTGIGGVELSVVEGQIAGYAAAGMHGQAHRRFGVRRKFRRFARAMERAFALRPELRDIAAETVLCRCEDVTIGSTRNHRSWREAKLHTRCGMGPCQGRICGGAAAFLFDWETAAVRPPVFPVQVAHLAAAPVAQKT